MSGRADSEPTEPVPVQPKDGEATAGGRDPSTRSTQNEPLAAATDLHGTPTARRAGSGGSGGLGLLRPPSTHTPENASMYSSRSGVESISGESKPPSQKSGGMGFVRRLRRLSSAALHGKVNRLFSRPSNPSQDSLVQAGPPSPHAYPPSSATPHSHFTHTGAVPNDARASSPRAGTTTPAAEWRAGNSADLPPLPPNPLSSRRNRALTEVTPLAIRGRMEPAAVDSPKPADNASQQAMCGQVKASNSPLIASPLSRKSFHTLNAASSRDNLAAPTQSLIPQTPTSDKSSRVKSPKLIRSSSHTHGQVDRPRMRPTPAGPAASTADNTPRPLLPHRLSYQLTSSYEADLAYQAAQTPSPPERAASKSHAHFAAGTSTPTMSRRRTALATLGWPGSRASPAQPSESDAAFVPPPPLSKGSNGCATNKAAAGPGIDSPSSLLSAFQLRPRVSSGRFRQTNPDASARSSASITSDSMRSWASALSDTDRDNGNDSGGSRKGSERNSLSLAALECAINSRDNDPSSSLAPAPTPGETLPHAVADAPPSQPWPSTNRLRGFFYPSILDWQLSQDESTTPYSHLPALSTVNAPAGAAVGAQLPIGASSCIESRISSPELRSRTVAAAAGHSRERFTSEPVELDATSASPSSDSPSGVAPYPAVLSASQAARPRGGSQPIHLAKAATANAIRLKERSAAQASDSGMSASSRASPLRAGPGSAPESFSIDAAMETNQARLRTRATSASNQPANLNGEIADSYEAISSGRNNSAGTSQHNPPSKSTLASGTLPSRPPSSMSAYTMSPISSSAGDEHHLPSSHFWQPVAMFRASPERSGDGHPLPSAGLHTPSSTSSPPVHHQLHHPSSHQLRLNMSSVQRSASGHSVSSGITELLEPSSVSMARKDALWQVLVVSKSRADTEIDKLLRQWRETDGGMVVCVHDAEAKPGAGDEDAIILKVKRGHRRSTSDMKRADSERNEFRRRVIDLASLIRSSSVSELSNEAVTRGVTEQLYGLLTEQRTRFSADANIGALILDVLYQFSAVSQTVSQLAMPLNPFIGVRGGVSGDASPAVSQFPSPQLVPELSLTRGSLNTLPPLTTALASHHDRGGRHMASRSLGQRESTDQPAGMFADSAGTPHSSIGRAQSISSTVISDAMSDLNDYRISRTASEGPVANTPPRIQHSSTDMYLLNGASVYVRPADGTSHVSSPRLLPGTENGSSTSLPSVLTLAPGSGYHVGGSVGRSGLASSYAPTSVHSLSGVYSRQRLYMPPLGTVQTGRMSIDMPDAETDVSSRPSLDDTNLRPSLDRQPSQLSISSDAGGTLDPSRKRGARASLQPQSHYPSADRSRDAATVSTPKRMSRPATMYISNSGFGSLRRVSDAASRQERLARLLSEDTDFSDSAPTSPIDTPIRPYIEASDEGMAAALPPPLPTTAGLISIPEAKRSDDVLSLDRSGVGMLETVQSASVPAPATDMFTRVEGQLPLESFRKRSRPSIILEEQDEPSSEFAAGDGPLTAEPEAMEDGEVKVIAPGDRHVEVVPAAAEAAASTAAEAAEHELVVCRICERSIARLELSAHSDICILEQTRAIKLDEANHRLKRVRDSLSKRLVDLKKSRQWDKAATRESERIIRIADRALFWPVGDSQQELIVAKAKFSKYTEKLEGIAGPGKAASLRSTGASANAARPHHALSARLPRADIETLWLARQLQGRIQEKCDIIDEFDQEFSRLEAQEALMREAVSADAEVDASASDRAHNPFMALPTWSQLAQSKHRSPAPSERTSMDLTHSQSESGSATPDVTTPQMLGMGKLTGTLSRRQSRPSRSGRRSLSRPSKLGSDAGVEPDGPTSGSRKLVSLFAALFRSNHGLGRHRDGSSNAILRRKNPPSPFAPGSLPASSRSSSVLHRVSQTATTPTTPTAGTSSGRSGSSSNANIGTLTETSAVAASMAVPSAAAAETPLASPVTRQRNNSQLSTMRGTPEAAPRGQRMPSIEDFDFVKPISRGAFGRVYLTRKKATQDLFAIKVMRKKDMINKNMVTQALAERRALSLLSTEWVVQLYYAFHSSKHLFLVMEYLVGGDLAGLLRVSGVMDEESARFYIGEIACAIDYLHRNSIVHRDIKPDNVILTSDGHIKLTDFGLSQVAVRGSSDGKGLEGSEGVAAVDTPSSSDTPPPGDADLAAGISDKTEEYWTAALAMAGGSGVKTPAAGGAQAAKALPLSKRAHARKSSRGFLGTPDYLAPELLLGAGNGLAVDWWALGVCLFEFICGYPPFMDESPEAIFRNILNHAIDWPDEEGFVSPEAIDLINALLRPEPATRAHWKDIQASKLYEGWDLANVRQREPPFVPQPDDDIDTSYFEACQRKELQRLSNATFLQIETSRAQQATETALEQESPSVATRSSRGGSQRGSRGGSHRSSRRQRSASGSASAVNGGSGARTSVGQLKKLFADMSTVSQGEANPPGPHADVVVSRNHSSCDSASNAAGSPLISSPSSSESFLMDDAADAAYQNKRSSRVPTTAMAAPQFGTTNESAGPSSDGRGSISSLSDSDVETPPSSRGLASERQRPVPANAPLSERAASSASPPAQSLLNPAKRALCRSPSQLSDGGIVELVASAGPSSKSHSRCASVSTTLLAGRKPSVSVRSRRPPSQGAGAASELDAATAVLVRSSSTDERLPGNSDSVGGTTNAGDAGLLPSSARSSDAEDEIEDEDDETERVFEDFTYKNLALLNHVNRGMSSSSGSASPMPERPPPGPAALVVGSTPLGVTASGSRTPARESSFSATRESPAHSYEAQ